MLWTGILGCRDSNGGIHNLSLTIARIVPRLDTRMWRATLAEPAAIFVAGQFTPDGTHPHDDEHQVLADAWTARLRSLPEFHVSDAKQEHRTELASETASERRPFPGRPADPVRIPWRSPIPYLTSSATPQWSN